MIFTIGSFRMRPKTTKWAILYKKRVNSIAWKIKLAIKFAK